MTWVVRAVLFVSGIVAGWFIPRDRIGYDIVQFVVAILFLLLVSLIVLYYPRLRGRRATSDESNRDEAKRDGSQPER